jgi:hypothetical protein
MNADGTVLVATARCPSIIWWPNSVDSSAGHRIEDCHKHVNRHWHVLCRHTEMSPKARAGPVTGRTNAVDRNSAISRSHLTRVAHTDQVRWVSSDIWRVGPLLKRIRDLSERNGVLLYKQLLRPVLDCACPLAHMVMRSSQPHPKTATAPVQHKLVHIKNNSRWYVSSIEFTRIWGFHSSLTTSEHKLWVLTQSSLKRGNL